MAKSKLPVAKKQEKKKIAPVAKEATLSTESSSEVAIDRRTKNVRSESDRRDNDRRKQSVPVAVDRRAGERRAKVSRRRQIDPTTCERDYSDDEVNFMRAMDEYKRSSGRMFPTCSEILEVIRALGYQKMTIVQSSVTDEIATPAMVAMPLPSAGMMNEVASLS